MKWNNRNRHLPRVVIAALVMSVSLGACDDDDDLVVPPVEDEEGTVELAMVDEDPTAEDETVTGEFTADVTAQLWVDDDWQDVSGLSATSLTFDLGAEEDVVGSTTVDADTYDEARIVLSNVSVVVNAGSEIGEEPLEEDVTLTVAEGGEVIVGYAVPVVLPEDGTVRLVLDLNSQAWLTEQALETEAISATEFETAVSLTAR